MRPLAPPRLEVPPVELARLAERVPLHQPDGEAT